MTFQRWVFLVLGLVFSPYLLFAGTVRLINNSPYDLRVVIRGSDGSFLGEVVVKAQKETVWTDTYGQYGMYGGANPSSNENIRSKTPYTTLWYCLDGSDYAVCDTVSTGAVVTAQGCLGARMCKPKKTERYPSQPEGHYLYQEPKTPPLGQ
ncbi:MAG: hypothetical protein JSS60_07160 [Verrucomicrobia bacterium]|nr:hypothetical protein [Verrucomicrobiota bacterium]